MIVTEDEARERFCCGPDACGAVDGEERWCAASRCMAWRWRIRVLKEPGNFKSGYAAASAGYCGLAGDAE